MMRAVAIGQMQEIVGLRTGADDDQQDFFIAVGKRRAESAHQPVHTLLGHQPADAAEHECLARRRATPAQVEHLLLVVASSASDTAPGSQLWTTATSPLKLPSVARCHSEMQINPSQSPSSALRR